MKKASRHLVIKYAAIALVGWLCLLAAITAGSLVAEEADLLWGFNRTQIISIAHVPKPQTLKSEDNGLIVHVRFFNGSSFEGLIDMWINGDYGIKTLTPYRTISILSTTAQRLDPIDLTRVPYRGYPIHPYIEYQSSRNATFAAYSANGHADFYYPFDAYCFGFTPESIFLDSDSGQLPVQIQFASFMSELPSTYRLRYGGLRYTTGYSPSEGQSVSELRCDLAENQKPDIASAKELDAYIDHPIWFRAFVLLMVSILFGPILLLLRGDSSSLSMDVLAGFVSVITVRTIVLGSDLSFHLIDFFIGGCLLTIAVIPLMNLIKNRGQTRISS